MLADSWEAAERSTLGTYRVEQYADYERVVPDFTRARAAALDNAMLPAERLRREDFFPFLVPGTREWEDFFSTRKVIEREVEGGFRLASVTTNVAEATSGFALSDGGPEGKVKRFEVVQLLSDLTLADRFDIKGALRADIRNLAVVETQKAAEVLQTHVRQYEGYERATVSAGRYGYSWKAARGRLVLQAARFNALTVTTPALFVGDKVFMYGEDGNMDSWRVFGPERCAWLVRLVHRMVACTSCQSVAFAMGPELTILDIDIHDGDSILSPVRERHAGDHDEMPVLSADRLLAQLSISRRGVLEELCEGLHTVAVNGENCATAVRVTQQHVLLNAHVVSMGGTITVDGVVAYPHKMLSRDLWVARCAGRELAWHLRAPKVGEQVVLCYRRNDQTLWSDPVALLSGDDDTIALERSQVMARGVSGAAVVAVDDFALLGVYDGVTMRSGIACVFSSAMFTGLCTYSELDEGSRASACSGEGTVYSKMKDRGLGKVIDAAMAAVVPLYAAGEHVGMGVSQGGTVLTVCDPDMTPLAPNPDATPLVFSSGPGPFKKADLASESTGPAVVRKAGYGEGVLVVGKDAQGMYYGHSNARVVHVGLDSAFFQLKGLDKDRGLPLFGGLVVAHSDAAVLGVFGNVRSDKRHGEVAMCYSIPEASVTVVVSERPEAAIRRLFPYTRPGTWPEGLAEEALTHGSAACEGSPGFAGLAMVGDCAMRTQLWIRLRDAKVSTARWQTIVQSTQSNAAQVAASEKLELGTAIKMGNGARLVPGSKVYADALEAVAGAVWMAEPLDVFETFCEHIGALKKDYTDEA